MRLTAAGMRDASGDMAGGADGLLRRLAAAGSVEVGGARADEALAVAEFMPRGAFVYVPHTPRHDLDAILACAAEIREAGLEPAPHLAARRFGSREEARDFLRSLARVSGPRRLLLLGGDRASPAGPFEDASSLLRAGLLQESGAQEIAFAGYPDGHPSIDGPLLARSLGDKIAEARRQGFSCRIVTQFSFSAEAVAAFCRRAATDWPGVPVDVGVAGPASPAAIARFARHCGVVASLRAAAGMGLSARRLAMNGDPTPLARMIAERVAAGPESAAASLHVFAFGGTGAAARWLAQAAR